MVFPAQLPLRPTTIRDLGLSSNLTDESSAHLTARVCSLSVLMTQVRDFVLLTTASGTQYSEAELDALEGIIATMRDLPPRGEA